MGAAHFPRSPRPPVHLRLLHLQVLLLLLALCAFTSASVAIPASPSAAADSSVKGDGDDNDDGDDDTPTPTTAPIYLPHYDQDDWSLVRGSIISKVFPVDRSTFLHCVSPADILPCRMSPPTRPPTQSSVRLRRHPHATWHSSSPLSLSRARARSSFTAPSRRHSMFPTADGRGRLAQPR